MIITIHEIRLSGYTVKSRFFEPPRETENWFEKSGVRNIGGKNYSETNPRETTFGSSYRVV